MNFGKPKNVILGVLRVIGGAALFFAVTEGLKLPFGDALLSGETLCARLIRVFRYAAASFLCIGVYPLTFKKTKKE